ncbi:MAG TPA: phosphoribosylglycinamide formyltransferase [Caulobacteraceae bacterium]|jgi:phosphoribosylglycinamide formyltransferase-1|nr:phosphoribosylglycinamide formyltransferase [Caulobacteraceae bacterium]
MKLAFLASNNGSSLRAIVAAIRAGELAARPRLVVSNRRAAPVLEFARAEGIEARFIPTVPDPDIADARLAEALGASGADLVILSGYLRKLGPRTLEAFHGRVLNIHPGLLPDFGGQGMYGRRVHEAVLAAGVPFTGASVHVVDEAYDHGPVVAQQRVPVRPGETAESLEARVMAAEPKLFVETLQRIADGSLSLGAIAEGR